jgi:hypothetical protein
MGVIILALVMLGIPQGFAYDSTQPNSLPLTGGTMTGDIDLNGNDLVCSPLTSDAVPSDFAAQACGAYPLAAVNTTGADVNIAGGHGSKSVVIDDFTQCALETVTVTVTDSDGADTANVLTEGTEWDDATSNAAVCLSLGSAVDAVTGVSADTSACAGCDKLGIIADDGVLVVLLAESAAACTTVANGTDGKVSIHDDLLVNGSLTVTGDGDFNGSLVDVLTLRSSISVVVQDALAFASNTFADAAIETDQTFDQLYFGLGVNQGRQLIIGDAANRDTDYGLATPTNPTVCVQSATTTDAERICASHDQTNAVIDIQTGALSMGWPSDRNGARNAIQTSAEALTFQGGGGDASKVTSGLIPDGAWLKGITTRVTTAGTTCASVDIGDGSDVDLYAAASAVTLSTTTDPSDHTATFANPHLAASEVTVTANGGNCVDLVILIVAYYETFAAPTSN